MNVFFLIKIELKSSFRFNLVQDMIITPIPTT